jgi:hypothetical protein
VGTATRTLAVAAAAVVCAVAAPARAESCTGITASGGRFATCFDLGNRLSLTAGTSGFGGALALRHIMRFDDAPDLVWKLEHVMLEASHAGFEDRFTGVLYRGRYLRHSRDGHLVLPFGNPPRKIFLPFDIGGLAEVGSISWRPDSNVRVGIIKTAALVDFARARGFRRRFALGPVARWDVDLPRDRLEIAQHLVAPFSAMLADLRFETASGVTTGELRVEAGSVFRTGAGWQPEAQAEATLERIVLAVDDRPIALVLGVRYDSATEETTAGIGARIVLVQRRDQRVSLSSLAKPARPARVAPPAPAPARPARTPAPVAEPAPAPLDEPAPAPADLPPAAPGGAPSGTSWEIVSGRSISDGVLAGDAWRALAVIRL